MLLIKTFGICLGFSVVRFYFSKQLLTKSMMTKIGSGYLAIQCATIFFFRGFIPQWIFIFVPILVFIGGHFIFCRWLESQFRSDFPDVITNIILQMKMGQSFRASLSRASLQVRSRYRPMMESIQHHVAFSQQLNDKKLTPASCFSHEIVDTFLQVDRSSHRAIEKLENFRRRLMIINDFRRRSGQIRGQIHMQATVITAIYALSFAFVAYFFPLGESAGLIAVSVGLFIAGLLVMFLIGRRVRWKI